MKKPSYLNVILTIIAILLALLVLEQRYLVKDGRVFNRITGRASWWADHYAYPPRHTGSVDHSEFIIDTTKGK